MKLVILFALLSGKSDNFMNYFFKNISLVFNYHVLMSWTWGSDNPLEYSD